MRKVHLLVIDPQIDFMDSPGSTLPVAGANGDMHRVAVMIDRIGQKLEDIHVTLDSHQVIHIGNPGMWEDKNGKQPAPYTIITANDIIAGIWHPRKENVRPADLSNKTIGQFVLEYVQYLESRGRVNMIWPLHCIIGTPGHAIQPELGKALENWASKYYANIDYVAKGTTPWVEHFGALMAEMPMANIPQTTLNTNFLQMLAEADEVLVAGEAKSHCVLTTVNQIAENIGKEHIAKFSIMEDATSPVGASGGVDFPKIADEWMHNMAKLGMTITTTDKVLR